jgi:transposase InsO family protein
MDDGMRTRLSAGACVTYDGQEWDIAELTPPSVLLAGPAGRLRRVSISHLLAAPGTRVGDPAEAEPPADAGLRLAGLGRAELAQLRERMAHVREACTGYRRGSPDLALPGEPRPEYAPGAGRLQRYQAKAAEMQVGVRTVERWAACLERDGPAGLVDERHLRRRAPQGGADSRWLAMARTVLAEHADSSTPTQDLILARTAARLDAEHGSGTVPLPGRTRARALLREITRGTSAFGGAKARREIAGRPAAPYGRLEATRPGEYLLLDTTRLDVFAMDPVTLRWVQAELTIAMDLFDRCITGLRLTPVSTKAIDAAAVLFESVRPLPEPAAGQADARPPYHGLPGQVIIDVSMLAGQDGMPLLPSVAAETVLVDHGKIYLSEHLMSACARLGISVQPARVYQATDKAALERFFRTLREQLLAALPGYKGPDVYRRGKNPEQQAFYFLHELERIVRRWTAECYHRQPHDGLCLPQVPGLQLCPLEMFAHGAARAGFLQVPARADLVFDFLKAEWRTIQHYGVEIGGLRYDGPALNGHRNETSPYGGEHAGRWPLRVDTGDVSRVWFQDPDDGSWHALKWEHADALGAPFSSEALDYARQLAAATHRFPDTRRALAELLEQWGAGLAGDRAGRRMALRLSEQRLRLVPAPPEAAPGQAPGETAAGARDDDSGAGEAGGPPRGQPPGGDPGDFYADAMETV